MKKLTLLLRSQLPKVDERNLTPNEVFHAQLLLVADRITRQYATSYVKNFYHGATSPSNIELNGKALDHGPMSGVDGFSRIKYADDAANGDWSNVVDDILSEFFDDLRFTLDRDLQSSVPTLEEVSQKVEASYKDQMHETFLWRLGIPSELLMRVSKTSQSKALTDLLLQIALACNYKIHSAKARIPLKTGKFNFARIVKRLVKANATQSDLTWALRFDIWDTELRNELISSYLAFLQAAEKEADVTASELSAQARVNVDLRNKSYKRLFRGPVLWTKQLTVIRVSGLLGRESIIGNFIDRMIGSNTHAYSAPSPARKQSQVQLPVPLRNQCIAIFK